MGSEEHKSTHELVIAIIWLVVSSGVKGVSAGVSGETMMGDAFLVRVTSGLEKAFESERVELSKASTRE